MDNKNNAVPQAAPVAEAVPEGFALVPLMLTRDMQDAYFKVIDKNMQRVTTDPRFGRWDNMREAYKAMLAAAPQPPAAQEVTQQAAPDEVRQCVRDAVAEALAGLYYCGKVWSAWGYGTMREDDFSPADEDDDIIENVTDAAMNAMVLASVTQQAAKAEPVAKVVETDMDISVIDAILPIGTKLYLAPTTSTVSAPDEIRNQAIEEVARLFDDNPHAEQFNCNVAEAIRELKRTTHKGEAA